MDDSAPLAPVGGDRADRHEAERLPFVLDQREHLEAGTEPGERLAEAGLEVGSEVEDAVTHRQRVEPVGARRYATLAHRYGEWVVSTATRHKPSAGGATVAGPSAIAIHPRQTPSPPPVPP